MREVFELVQFAGKVQRLYTLVSDVVPLVRDEQLRTSLKTARKGLGEAVMRLRAMIDEKGEAPPIQPHQAVGLLEGER